MATIVHTPRMWPPRSAIISGDQKYRYVLSRSWAKGKHCTFVMLNPSTADGQVDDATIRRCTGFARRFEFDGFHVVNLYVLRATNPKALQEAADPIGNPENDGFLVQYTSQGVVIAAWGAHRFARERSRAVGDMLRAQGVRLFCLGLTKDGSPRHPLYLPADSCLVPFEEAS